MKIRGSLCPFRLRLEKHQKYHFHQLNHHHSDRNRRSPPSPPHAEARSAAGDAEALGGRGRPSPRKFERRSEPSNGSMFFSFFPPPPPLFFSLSFVSFSFLFFFSFFLLCFPLFGWQLIDFRGLKRRRKRKRPEACSDSVCVTFSPGFSHSFGLHIGTQVLSVRFQNSSRGREVLRKGPHRRLALVALVARPA